MYVKISACMYTVWAIADAMGMHHLPFSRMSGAGNLLNVILDVILILLLGLGVEGAAIATVISEYVLPVFDWGFHISFMSMVFLFSGFLHA